MNDLDRVTDLIRKRVKVEWDEQYLELGAIRLASRRVRRARFIAFVSIVAACAVVVAGLRWHAGVHAGDRTSPATAVVLPAPGALGEGSSERTLRFSDGSIAIPVDDQVSVSIAEDTPSRAVAVLTSGSCRFEVVARPSRMFAVRAGSVTVFVIGTVFTVERTENRVYVSVERGRVRVEWPAGEREIGAGDRASFAMNMPADTASVPSSSAAPRTRPPSGSPPAWRLLAEQRRFQEAYRLLPETPQLIETPQDLLLAADSARLSGHPEAATKYLAKIVSQYPKDFSAQLAAFSLGSIYLDQLDRPIDAALRFGQARALAGTGALAEDALARQLEALVRSGDTLQAHARAEEYVRLFPTGRQVDLARRLGGLD